MKEVSVTGWQIDDQGRRYRMVGDCKEFATVITTTRGTFYQDDLDKIPPQEKEEVKKQAPLGTCPFKKRLRCSRDCVFFSAAGCMESPPGNSGKCPLSGYPCDQECMLYSDDGCKILRKWRKA